jgi:hypothetical protein
MIKINSIFDWIKQISYDKEPWSSFSIEEQDIFNNFMINKIISMNPNYIELVAEVQESQLPKDKLYKFYCQFLPKQKFYNKYQKPSKLKFNKDVLTSLSIYFQISVREALDYCDFLPKQDIIDILLQLGKSDEEIKKLKIN